MGAREFIVLESVRLKVDVHAWDVLRSPDTHGDFDLKVRRAGFGFGSAF
jgi:hypothetical protein